MQKVNIGIIGTGWCGGIRAETCAASPYVSELHIAEIKEARLKEVAEKTKPVTATTDYRALLEERQHQCNHRLRHAGNRALSDGQGNPARGKTRPAREADFARRWPKRMN